MIIDKEQEKMKLLEDKNFYPTPKHLIEQMLEGCDYAETILEPSAGKGDIVDFLKQKQEDEWYRKKLDIDCIEINPLLQAVLKGNEHRVVHDDFFTYKTLKKYELIIMNPPFDNGDKHLLKALELQQNGGKIICLLNAETLRNPYTNIRKELVNKLQELEANIEYIQDAFTDAERKTSVEVALIKLSIPEREFESDIFENMRKAATFQDIEVTEAQAAALVHTDFIKFLKSLVMQFNIEVSAGTKLIIEYQAMKPHILFAFEPKDTEGHTRPILELTTYDCSYVRNINELINNFVKEVRGKYWRYLFANDKFMGQLTSNLQAAYQHKIQTMKDYEFSIFNILTIKEDVQKRMNKGIEDTILELFEELSNEHHYYNETSKNRHYYNGWKTNKCYKINDKIIIPFYMLYGNSRLNTEEACKKMNDITKVFDYLDCGRTQYYNSIYGTIRHYFEINHTKKIPLKYFDVTFYKKGTCHIHFKNKELLDKFNLFGSQNKGWLPPNYGKKPYADMDKEEQEVVKEFSGSIENYNKIYNNQQYYIVDKQKLLVAEND